MCEGVVAKTQYHKLDVFSTLKIFTKVATLAAFGGLFLLSSLFAHLNLLIKSLEVL